MATGSEQKATAGGAGAAGPLSPPDFADLPPRTRRRLMLRSLARAVLTVTLLVVLYYVLPMDHAFDSATIVLLLVGLLVFIVVVSW